MLALVSGYNRSIGRKINAFKDKLFTLVRSTNQRDAFKESLFMTIPSKTQWHLTVPLLVNGNALVMLMACVLIKYGKASNAVNGISTVRSNNLHNNKPMHHCSIQNALPYTSHACLGMHVYGHCSMEQSLCAIM